MVKSLLLLGSTGSIGRQTLELVRAAPDRFRVVGLAARRSAPELLAQVREFRPRAVALAEAAAVAPLAAELSPAVALRVGPEAATELAAELDYDLAVQGMVGAAGLLPSMSVLERGRPLALANKESLVIAGEHLMELSRARGAPILPIDSEHSAIFQCLRGEDPSRVRCVYLTASGGPFRDLSPADLDRVTPSMALDHPNWSMGPRITVGSATLMNKALEVVETHHLFGMAAEQIRVLLHRQSIVHSMVEFVDGSVIAQMGPPDMRGPIHFALHHPDRAPSRLVGFDATLFRTLSFEEVDPARFPTLELGFRCVREGSDAGCVLNAADEVAVAAFLEGRIAFPEIARVNRRVLDARPGLDRDVFALLEADARARAAAHHEIAAPVGGR
ncbi:MAG: 1-deoxy-D-xylulose-5-phosphate reductoisomerase [Planctomycetota bacterium]